MNATDSIIATVLDHLAGRLRQRAAAPKKRTYTGFVIDFQASARAARLANGIVLIKDFMEGNGITCRQLSLEAGVSMRTIALLRKGASPQLGTAERLATACSKLVGRPVAITELFDVEVVQEVSFG